MLDTERSTIALYVGIFPHNTTRHMKLLGIFMPP